MKGFILLFVVLFHSLGLADDELTRVLKIAGENRAEIEKALKNVPVEQKKGMDFLVKYMPESDLKTLKGDFLIKNVAIAYRAREDFVWARNLPEEIFFNDVLPYAVLDETRDDWRQDFYDRFSKYVKDAVTMEEAIKAVNFSIMDEVNVKYSRKRKKPHQSPYESMEIHVASCTGLSILLVDAFRSVGIPARVAGIPKWTTKYGNHNWVEVWTPVDEGWHCTEFNPDRSGNLDLGWYIKDASKANPKSFYHSVYATSWRTREVHFPMVWNMQSKQVHGINVSDFYIKLGGVDEADTEDLCELRIDHTVGGERVSVPVAVSQSDVKISEGDTPKSTNDMNHYYSVSVKRGQLYQVMWRAPGEDNWRRVEVLPKQTQGDKSFFRLKLEK